MVDGRLTTGDSRWQKNGGRNVQRSAFRVRGIFIALKKNGKPTSHASASSVFSAVRFLLEGRSLHSRLFSPQMSPAFASVAVENPRRKALPCIPCFPWLNDRWKAGWRASAPSAASCKNSCGKSLSAAFISPPASLKQRYKSAKICSRVRLASLCALCLGSSGHVAFGSVAVQKMPLGRRMESLRYLCCLL